MNNDDPKYLREAEIALMDTLKLVFEIIVAKGISEPEILSEALLRQAKQYPPQDMAAAVYVVEQLRASINDPDRKELRELLSRPVQGHA
jgi:hypothetical protein